MYTYKSKKCATRKALGRPVVQLGQEFCMETSIHGFRHIAEPGRHWMERTIWVAATFLAGWGAVYVSLGQLQRYNESPTVVTLEKNFRSWHYSLPAITACMKNRVDPTKVPQVIMETWNIDSSHENYDNYSKFVHTVALSDLLHLDGYQEYMDDERLNVDLYKIAVGVMANPDIKTTTSERASLKWWPIMTEAGVCYATNSLALEDVAIFPVNPNESTPLPLSCKYGATICQILVEIGEPADLYFHSPYDVLDLTSPADFVEPGIKRMLDIGVTETGCGRGVNNLSPERRGCRFIDEPDEGRKVYSTNSCRLSCRNKVAMNLCGCRPFYYPYEAGPACNVSGMRCLSRHSQQLASIEGVSCSCSAQCLYSVFSQIASSEYVWTQGPFSTEGSCRYSVLAPKVRYTREIVFHFQDLVVSFGGAAGLFLGASFISFVEIFYFILLRVLRAVSMKEPRRVEHTHKQNTTSFEEQRIKELTSILEQNRFHQVTDSRYNDYHY